MYEKIVVCGIVLSMIYYELTHLSTGGMVTPAYIALCLGSPLRILYTAILALAAWGILKLLSQVWIIYGKRKFAIAVLITFFLDLIIGFSGELPYGLRAVGFLIPALLVRDIEKQGLIKTTVSTGIVTSFLALFMLWFGVL